MRPYYKIFSFAAAGLLCFLMVATPFAKGKKKSSSSGDKPRGSVVITAVLDDCGEEVTELEIHGNHFMPHRRFNAPRVFLGREGGEVEELDVQAGFTNNVITAAFSATDPGSYRLMVITGPGRKRTARMDITLCGGSGGDGGKGDPGDPGPPGGPGPKGDAGDPAPLSSYERVVGDCVIGAFSCSATCGVGRKVLGGGYAFGPLQPSTPPIVASYPSSDETWEVKIPQSFGNSFVPLDQVYAVCASAAP